MDRKNISTYFMVDKKQKYNLSCVGRESNPGPVDVTFDDGNDGFYH